MIESTERMSFYCLFLLFVEGLPALNPLEGTHTWFESYKRCKLVGENVNSAILHDKDEAWIGGYFTNTRWMAFIGCFKITPNRYTPIIQLLVKDTEKALAFCSNACSSDDIFTIQKNWCVCFGLNFHEKYNSIIDSRYCNNDCICDGRNWYKGYQHVNGHLIPRRDYDQSLRCSVEIRRNNKLPLYDAVDCEWCKRNENACVGLQRYKYIQWTDDCFFDKVCEYFQNHTTKCVLARKRKDNGVEFIEEPCTNLHPAACNSFHQDDQPYCSGVEPSTTALPTETHTTTQTTTSTLVVLSTTSNRTTSSTSLTISSKQAYKITSTDQNSTPAIITATKATESSSIIATTDTQAASTKSTTTSTEPMQSIVATKMIDSTTELISTETMTEWRPSSVISTSGPDNLTTYISENKTMTTQDDSNWSTSNLAFFLSVVVGSLVGVTLIFGVIFYIKRTKRRQIYNNGQKKENPPSASFSMIDYDDDPNNVYSEPSDLEMDKQDRLRVMLSSLDNVKHQHKYGYDNSEYNSLNFTMQSNPLLVDNNIYDRSNKIGDYTYSACSLKKTSHPEKIKARNNRKPLVAVKPFKHYENGAYAETTIRHSEFTYDTPKND